ncbi:hypothetical protein Tco_0475218 [Tanacetum coccineum]
MNLIVKHCLRGGLLCQYAVKNEWKDLLHQTKSVKYIGNSKEVGILRYLSLVVSLKMVGDEAVHKELGDRMERVATTASTLEAEQNSSAQTRFETTSKQPNDPPFLRVNTLASREDSIKLMKLMAHCTKLSALLLEIHLRRPMKFWKIIRVEDHTEVYQTFADMLKNFDRYDLVKLWELIKERFNTTEPIYDNERELLVELKRLFKPDTDDLMDLHKYMYDPLTWRL